MSDETPFSDFSSFPRDRLHIAGWQASEGDPTSPYGHEPTPVDEAHFGGDLASAHRVLYRFDDAGGDAHWYWIMGGVEDPDQAVWGIVDLQRSGEYKELSE